MTETETRPSPRDDAEEAYRQFQTLDDKTFATAYAQRHGMTEAEQIGIARAAAERSGRATIYPPELGPPTLGDHDDAARLAAAYPEVEGEPAIPELLPDVLTGELLPATPANAARAIDAAREMKDRIQEIVAAATTYLAEESRRLGTRTIQIPDGKIVLSGGDSTEIDPATLRETLTEAGCPPERIEQAIKVKVEETVDRSVLRSLAAANEDYAAAIELATTPIRTPIRASVKR